MKLLSLVGVCLFALSASAQDQCFTVDQNVDFVPNRLCFESVQAELKPFNFNVTLKGSYPGTYEVIADSKTPVNGIYHGNIILSNNTNFKDDNTHSTDLRMYLSFDDAGVVQTIAKISGEQLVQFDPMHPSRNDKRISITYTKE